MKKDIHPTSQVVKATCNSCKNSFDVHSTIDSFEVEVCSKCHPFYTGDQRIMDTAGRADKFRKRMEKAAAIQSDKPAKKASQKEEIKEESAPEEVAEEAAVEETPEVANEAPADEAPATDTTEDQEAPVEETPAEA